MNPWASIASFLLMAFVASCAPAAGTPGSATDRQRDGASAPKRIVAAIQGETRVLATALSPRGTAGSIPGLDSVEDLIHAGLGGFDDRDQVWPQLAEAIPSVENGLWKLFPDGQMETTWRLRDRTAWHDGTPFTADDVLFTAQVAREKRVPAFGGVAFDSVTAVSAPDARTVTVTWATPYIDADTLFTHLTGRGMPLPRHLLETAYTDAPDTFLDLPYWNVEFVGAGPFRVKDLVLGSHLTLTANQQYVLGPPRVSEIEVRFIPDANALVTSILAGAAQMSLGARLAQEAALQARAQWTTGTVEIKTRGGGWVTAYPQFIDPRPAVIGDVQFRRALVHALDRQEMVDTLMSGITAVAHGIVNPEQAEYADIESSIVRYPYEPARTVQIVSDLGYQRGADGQFRDASGRPLTIETQATDQTPIQPKTLQAVADYWRKAGIGVDTVVVPNQRVTDREYRMARSGFEVLSNSNDPRNFANYRSGQVPLPQNSFVGNNRSRYASPELDSLINQYFNTIPLGERNAILGQIVHHLTDRVVMMGLFYNTTHGFVAHGIVNVNTRGHYATEAWNANLWDVVTP